MLFSKIAVVGNFWPWRLRQPESQKLLETKPILDVHGLTTKSFFKYA